MTTALKPPGCMPICTAWKAICRMPDTGIARRENPWRRGRSIPNGTRSWRRCWAPEALLGAGGDWRQVGVAVDFLHANAAAEDENRSRDGENAAQHEPDGAV